MYNEDTVDKFEEDVYPWVVFKISKSLYTVKSNLINSIVVLPENITKIPNVPNYILGLIQLRGNVIPLTDLRLLFNMKAIREENNDLILDEKKMQNKEMVIVIEIDNSFMGILVDEVLSVEKITILEETEEIKKMGKDVYIKGIAKGNKKNDVLLIIDEEKIMNMV
ncbi:MAG: chemotaxis protein CheW [Sedimentibacter sp.]